MYSSTQAAWNITKAAFPGVCLEQLVQRKDSSHQPYKLNYINILDCYTDCLTIKCEWVLRSNLKAVYEKKKEKEKQNTKDVIVSNNKNKTRQ